MLCAEENMYWQITWQPRFGWSCSLHIRVDWWAEHRNAWMNMTETALDWLVTPTPWPREGSPTQPQCNSCNSGLPIHPHLAMRWHMELTGTDGGKSIKTPFLFNLVTYLFRCFHIIVQFVNTFSLQQLSAVRPHITPHWCTLGGYLVERIFVSTNSLYIFQKNPELRQTD
jgi:hypothetical protein